MMPILDRRPEFDPRSRAFQLRGLLTPSQLEAPARSFTWSVPIALDQGQEGACVGFAWSQELAARPYPDATITNAFARDVYQRAQRVDEWPGEDYQGTSVLAGAKVLANELGRIGEYRWAGAGTGTALDDLVRGIAYKGPAVAGLNWYTGMFQPDSSGRIRPTGSIEGGHAILMPRVTGERYRITSMRRRVYVYNSWGRSGGWPWAWMDWDDVERLLEEQGEACIVVRRITVS